MKFSRLVTLSAISALFLGVTTLGAPSANALTPTNDSIDSATRLRTPPARYLEDTSQATADSADGKCAGGHSVWFRSRSAVTRTVRLSTVGSDYDTVLAVFSGPKTNRTLVGCSDDAFNTNAASAKQIRFVAGTTYWVAVSAFRRSPGGQLVLHTWLPGTVAGISVTIDTVESGTVSGQLLVTGTVHCNTPSEFEVSLGATQRVNNGASVARGSNVVDGVCDPADTATSWSLAIDSETGWAFQPGTVRLTQTAFDYDGFSFAQAGPETNNFVVTANANALRSTR